MRLFIAFEIPDRIADLVLNLQKEIADNTHRVRPVSHKNLHITVKFLGEQLPQSVGKIAGIIKKNMNNKPIKIKLDKAGVFKNMDHPQVLWLGENNRVFEDFSLELNRKLDIFRPSDNKPFCHLTIGRMKYIKREELIRVLNLCREFISKNDLSFTVDGIGLFESTLKRSGAEYRLIEKFNFKG